MQYTLETAKTLFEELPEQLKATFNNEMHIFLNFAENPANLPQMEEWGLAVKNERLAQALQADAGKESPEASLSSGKSDESDAAEQLST
jgi:hypothetical protein